MLATFLQLLGIRISLSADGTRGLGGHTHRLRRPPQPVPAVRGGRNRQLPLQSEPQQARRLLRRARVILRRPAAPARRFIAMTGGEWATFEPSSNEGKHRAIMAVLSAGLKYPVTGEEGMLPFPAGTPCLPCLLDEGAQRPTTTTCLASNSHAGVPGDAPP